MATITVDTTSQRYSSDPQPEPDIILLHTTEGMSYPSYAGGGNAPHATVRALPGKGIAVREHIPFTDYAKALVHPAGTPETNRRGVLQFELMGTCDPRTAASSDAWYFWPDADDVVLQALADYLRPLANRYAIPAKAPRFIAYPGSYGAGNGVRMSYAEFTTFQGFCGHEHAPGNDHGDPGAFQIDKLFRLLALPAASRDEPRPPIVVTKPGTKAPAFPLPKGYYFGPADGGDHSISGFHPVGRLSVAQVRAYLKEWQTQMQRRGWRITPDGEYGPETKGVALAFGAEKHLGARADLIGPIVWAAAWTAPVTK